MNIEIKGTKLVEIPYLDNQLEGQLKNDDILIVGERIATEGILQAVLKRPFNSCLCTDIMNMDIECPLQNIIKSDKRVSFIQTDFVESNFEIKYKYILCINVLEHFGMNFSEVAGFSGSNRSDYIRWNHDIRAIEKMIKYLVDDKSKVIITVPVGSPVMHGDVNENNLMPFLRRYDLNRIKMIRKFVGELGYRMEEEFYYSDNFNDWYSTDESISSIKYNTSNNAFTPNIIWAFTILK
jgi:hypothetical protein